VPYVLPTAAEMKVFLPAFAESDDAWLSSGITEASFSVDTSWNEHDYQPAIIYLAAHLLTLRSAGQASTAGFEVNGMMTAGGLTKAKVGDVEVSFADNGGSVDVSNSDRFYGTVWGRLFLALRKRNVFLPLWV
jgi:hypothetical protein